MNILGISCFCHDSATCLLQDGKIVTAAQEERFYRKKHDPKFLHNALQYCPDEIGITIYNIDYVMFYHKPFLAFEHPLMSYLTVAPKGLRSWLEAMILWLGKKLYIPKIPRTLSGLGPSAHGRKASSMYSRGGCLKHVVLHRAKTGGSHAG